jgi:cell wall-associated NlpC family hydrolase
LRTILFPGHSIKAQPVEGLPLGCRLAVAGHDGELARLASGGFVPARHLAPLDAAAPDFVAVAERFIGVPYLWGGKTSLGIDCSGLVQIALHSAGLRCPRDSDMQEAALGRGLSHSESEKLQRGDLIFWPGHVAIVRDADSIVHANAYHMATAIESTGEAIARINAAGNEVTSIKRL